jgi:hypothetical protein
MERQKLLLLQCEEQGPVKDWKLLHVLFSSCRSKFLELAQTLTLRTFNYLEVSLLWQIPERRRPSLGPLIFKV